MNKFKKKILLSALTATTIMTSSVIALGGTCRFVMEID